MIETLNGIHETVNFKTDTGLRLYYNDKFEHYPPHWHTPLEIIMVIKETYQVICNNYTFNLEEGDILIINPGVIHSIFAPVNGERIIFQVDCSILHYLNELKHILSIISPVYFMAKNDSLSIYQSVHNILLDILNEYTKNDVLHESEIYSKLMHMFVLIGRNHTKQNEISCLNYSKQKEYTETFLSICEYISTNCCENLILDDVANIAGFSKFHFTRLFKQFTGTTFYKYLTQKRISFAEKLLINMNLSITDVALQSGFSSLSSFARTFKIIKGCTPTEFRLMYSF